MAFLKSALASWSEAPRDELTAVSGWQLLSIALITYGQDDKAADYFAYGVRIGERLGIFGDGPSSPSAGAWKADGDPDQSKAASYTAWGVYNWNW